jgi:drug/metabolite transporter (DMT)-like permease
MSEILATPLAKPNSASTQLVPPNASSPFGPGGSNAARGIGYMVAATLLFCLGDTLMKLAASTLPTTEVMFVRSLVATLVVTAALIVTGTIRRSREALVKAMALRATADASASLLFQSALARMQFADIMGVNQLQTLSLTAASAFFLGESVGWRRWSAVGVGLVGALLIIKPGTSAFDWWALAAVGAVLLASTREIATRKIPPTVPIPVIMMISSAVVTLASLAGALFTPWAMPGAKDLAMMIGAGFFSLTGQYCTISAIRSAELSVIAPFRYAAMIWALALGYVIWQHIPDTWSLIGIAAITSAGLYTFHRERVRKVKPTTLPT